MTILILMKSMTLKSRMISDILYFHDCISVALSMNHTIIDISKTIETLLSHIMYLAFLRHNNLHSYLPGLCVFSSISACGD